MASIKNSRLSESHDDPYLKLLLIYNKDMWGGEIFESDMNLWCYVNKCGCGVIGGKLRVWFIVLQSKFTSNADRVRPSQAAGHKR